MFYELEEKALSSSSTAAQSDSLWQQVKEVLEDPDLLGLHRPCLPMVEGRPGMLEVPRVGPGPR